MILLGLKIDSALIDEVLERKDQGRGGLYTGMPTVSLTDLVETKRNHPGCRCEEDHGLEVGMPKFKVSKLGTGCKERWVCSRLDALRRRMGY